MLICLHNVQLQILAYFLYKNDKIIRILVVYNTKQMFTCSSLGEKVIRWNACGKIFALKATSPGC